VAAIAASSLVAVMRDFSLERTQVVPRPLDEAWVFFSDARNL
jgi:hypothetical protein